MDAARFYFIRLIEHLCLPQQKGISEVSPTYSAFYFHALHQMTVNERTHQSNPELQNLMNHGRKHPGGTRAAKPKRI